ncbi:tRNA (N6-isopentenyl adenosine(37)-C2)-methylthiotransferase MiaB [bacterium]|nr:tRNA (N6-isopentenyl adenosine(37)-C2)-methylthiotransferase MiaB [bacterium]
MEFDKKYYIQVWGCQMNAYDADLINSILTSSGFVPVDNEDEANIVLLQTCSVRESAEVKVFNKISKLIKRKKNDNNGLTIGVCGCMAENQESVILKKYPEVDVLCGPNAYVELPRLIENSILGVKTHELIKDDKRDFYPQVQHKKQLRAYVAVMRGCDNFCSYCIVPYVRGREKSMPPDKIFCEAQKLVDNGCREITLLGQNVNSYGKEYNMRFVDLLNKLNSIDGQFRLRFLTSHPKDADKDLFKAIRDLDKVCPYLHLPIQSGSNKILEKMNRKYTRENYLRKIDLVKELVPDISLSSDFIVGFPSETEDDFQDTLDVMNYVEYDSSFIFKYSVRYGTSAAKYEGNVPKQIKEDRNRRLLELQEKISLRKNKKFLNKKVQILVEGKSKRNPERLFGRSLNFKRVVFTGDEKYVGKYVNVSINKVTPLTLFGTIENV